MRFSELGPSTTAFYRFFLALPLLYLLTEIDIHRSRGTTPRFSTKRTRLLMITAGLFFAADIAFWHWSIEATTVANATLLTNFAPVFVTFGAWMLFRERPTPLFALGLILALAGAALLLGASFRIDPTHLRGDLLGLTSAIFYAGYQLTIKHVRRARSSMAVITSTTLVSAIALFVLAAATETRLIPHTSNGWLTLLGLALVAQVIGQGFIVYGLAHLPAGFASLTLLVQPIVAALLAWTLLGESLTPMAMIGGIVVLTGIVIARNATARPYKAPPP